jgi:hypothetical protein
MAEVNDTTEALRPAPQVGPGSREEECYNPLLITFALRRSGGDIQVRCRGCREIAPLSHSMLDHLKGVIELDGQCIPVIDAGVRFRAEGTEIGLCSCILVVEHECGTTQLRTGVIVNHIEEVMQLAAGTFRSSAGPTVSVNTHFVVEACCSTGPHELLAETHRELGPLDEEYARLREAAVVNGIGVGSEGR